MVAGANTYGDAATRASRGRRMLMAIQRGFCVMNCWSPVNLMTAIVSTAVPAAPSAIRSPANTVRSVDSRLRLPATAREPAPGLRDPGPSRERDDGSGSS